MQGPESPENPDQPSGSRRHKVGVALAATLAAAAGIISLDIGLHNRNKGNNSAPSVTGPTPDQLRHIQDHNPVDNHTQTIELSPDRLRHLNDHNPVENHIR